jgi:hypothetical protein
MSGDFHQPASTVYLIDDGVLKRVNLDGGVEILARDLMERKLSQLTLNDQHAVMGTWTDEKENVYTAIYGARKVKKLDKAKNVTVVAETSIGWSPTGGLTATSGCSNTPSATKPALSESKKMEPA